MQFLPEAERAQANRDHDEVEAAYRSGGVGAAMRLFVAKAGLDFANREEGVELPRPKPDRAANLEFFLRHDVPAVRRHELDLKLLLASPTRIVPAGGQTSRQFVAYRCAKLWRTGSGRPSRSFQAVITASQPIRWLSRRGCAGYSARRRLSKWRAHTPDSTQANRLVWRSDTIAHPSRLETLGSTRPSSLGGRRNL